MSSGLTNLIAILACAAIAARLLLFRRGHRRHHRLWSLVAWLLINASLALALHLLWGALSQEAVRWHVALLLAAAALQVHRARGNAAKLLRWRP